MSEEIDRDNPEWTDSDFASADTAEQLSAEWLAAFPRTAGRLSRRSIGAMLEAQAAGARVALLAA